MCVNHEPELRIKYYTALSGVGIWHGKLTSLRKTHKGARVLSLQLINEETIKEDEES